MCTSLSFLLSSQVPYNDPDQYLFKAHNGIPLEHWFYVQKKICGREDAANLCLVLTENEDMAQASFQIQDLGSLLGAIKQKQHQYCIYNSHQKTNM